MSKKSEPKEYRNLEVKLTDDELREKAAEVAAKRKQVNELKAAKKSTAAGYKTQIDALDAEIDHGCGVLREKTEIRSVECKWVRDDGRKMMVCVRIDTGAQVDQRQMSDKERQAELPGMEGEAPRLDGREAPRAEGEPTPTAAELPDLPQAEAAAPKKRGRPKKKSASTDLLETQANGAATETVQ